MSNPPLITDLDGTLIATDSLYEGFWNALRSRPLTLWRVFPWLKRGKQILKMGLLDAPDHVKTYPLNQSVLRMLQEATAAGREVWLATASPMPIAQIMASRLGIFSGIMGSTGDSNLKGAEKARALTERFGPQGFDYIGDSKDDLPVWAQARNAYVYGSKKLYEKALSLNPRAIHIPKRPQWKAALRELRIWQWVKNLLVFLPLLLTHDFRLHSFASTLLVFIALSLCASSAYVINDISDLANDRVHPVKCRRPLASGALGLTSGIFLAAGCLGAAFFLGCLINFPAACLLAFYFIGTLSYSFVFKKILILDALVLSGLYNLRVALGAAAIGVPVSNWLLSFLLLLFFGLALMKRSGDLEAEGERMSGRAYIAQDMQILMTMQTTCGFSAITILCLYVDSISAQALYSRPDFLWLAAPTLLWWYSYLLIKSGRGEVKGDPLLFALKIPVTWIAAGAVALCFAFAL